MPRAARPWFRFYVEACADRKLRRLKPEHRWLFVACLAAARQSSHPGELLVGDTPMDVDDLADFAGMTERQTAAGIEVLQNAGLVDPWPWSIPRWSERQYESDDVTQRTRKHRSKERSNVVPGNAPDTETDTETPLRPPPTPNRRAVAVEPRGAIPNVTDLEITIPDALVAPMPEGLRKNGRHT